MGKRIFDFILSLFGIIMLMPVYIIIGVLISLDSPGGILYRQTRVGKNNRLFKVLKFRTMRTDSFAKGALTVGSRDSRITPIGYFLRKFKLDELPQLFNVLKGDMSLVGPRPEVPQYTQYYTPQQQKVLSVKPGITDYASIKFRNENDLLAATDNPEEVYIQEIMPEKLRLNLYYIEEKNPFKDIKIILNTLSAIITK